jgi:MFS family permease
MGKIYKFYPAKPLFITGITLFEVGSAICGAAPNSTSFIVGRAIAGMGSSGIFTGAMVIIFHTVPLRQRPIYQGFGGIIFATGSVISPLLGGTFTEKVTWRWCFYINIPVGAVTIIIVTFILHLPNQKLDERASGWIEKPKQLDPIGNLFFLPGIVCLILSLQWGGTKYAWNDVRIIILLVLCGLLCLAFFGIQIWKKENATVPPRLVKQRSIAAAMWFSFFIGSSMTVMLYYLPIWFQAIKGVSAIKSGVMLLPLIISVVITSISSGIFVSKVGYYAPCFIFSSILMAIGAGLMSTFTLTTGHAKWIGYQAVFGLGVGFGMQQPINVVQTVLDRSDISTGSAVVMFTRFLGSSLFLPVAENIFLSRLTSQLSSLDISSQDVLDGGATKLRELVNGQDLTELLYDYNRAIVDIFYMVVATSSLTIIGSCLVGFKSLKSKAAGEASKTVEIKETSRGSKLV